MKRPYIAPKMNTVELEVEPILIAISSEASLPDTSWGGVNKNGTEADANERRGTWGNLWAEG